MCKPTKSRASLFSLKKRGRRNRCDAMGFLDGGGFELAHQLEAVAAWRPWLGDPHYAELRQHLASPAAWAAFMRADGSSSARLRLQLKVRALLFDKALECAPDDAAAPSQLNPTYLQLQGDSVYFSLEHDASDWARLQAERAPSLTALQIKYGLDTRDAVFSHHAWGSAAGDSKPKMQQRKNVPSTPKQGRSHTGFRTLDQSKSFGRGMSGSVRGGINDMDGETGMDCELWYDQWREKHLPERMNRLARRFAQQKLPFSEQDAFRRTPEGMGAFVSFSTRARKRHQLLPDNDPSSKPEREHERSSVPEDDFAILPEAMSPSNYVPENPCPGLEEVHASLYYGDALKTSSAAGAECSALLSGFSSHGLLKNGNGFTVSRKAKLTREEAATLSQQTISRILEPLGFEGVKQIPMDILSEMMISHIRNLGSRLRLLLDSYQKHVSTDELLRMFMHSAGGSLANLRSLTEYVKNERSHSSQVQQMDSSISSQLQPPPQLQVPSQSRQLSQQLALHQQNLANQQKRKQLASIRRRPADIRGGVEDLAGAAMEMKPFVPTLTKQAWMTQQQTLQMSHLKQQLSSLQLPVVQHPSGISGATKMASTRIEGLQEMLGSDAVKQETPDDLEGTLGSPNRRKRKMEY